MIILHAAQIPFLTDAAVILGLALLVILGFQRLKVPTIIGYLITGMIAGPSALHLIGTGGQFDTLSEIGIILLLFVIGMEFSIKDLLAMKRIVLIGGTLQVILTIALVAVLSVLIGFQIPQAIFLGFLLALSSTAIVLKIIQSRGELNSPHGKISLGILIFQDIIIVPMMLFIPLLAGESDNVGLSLLELSAKGALVVVMVILSAKFLIPKFLHAVASTRSQEIFILTIVVICFAVAWITGYLGLSMGLGAFLAGLIISESDYNHQAAGTIIPFREIFISFFFISVGALFEIGFLFEHFFTILLLTTGVFILKSGIAVLAASSLRYPLRTSLMTGFALFQVGEFSLLLGKEGIKHNLLDANTYQYFLAVSIFTMALTPFVIPLSRRAASFISGNRIAQKLNQTISKRENESEATENLNDHLIIIGFGLNGKNLARAAKAKGVPYRILEMNPDVVSEASAGGEPIYFGDATLEHVLELVKPEKARVAVIAISDPAATKRILQLLRYLNPALYIIVRTRFVNEMEGLYKLGANSVIPEEFETSIEIFNHVLHKYMIPPDQIEQFTEQVRQDNYQIFRTHTIPGETAGQAKIPGLETDSFVIQCGNNDVVGKTMKEAQVRKTYRVTVIGIQKEQMEVAEPEADTKIECGDRIFVVGSHKAITEFRKKLTLSP